MLSIVQNSDPVLRAKATEVPIADIKSARIRKILKNMTSALETQDDGVAIAAPQIGVSLRIFVVSKAVIEMPAELHKRAEMKDLRELKKRLGYLVFINPVITKLSREKEILDEGCLSVRPLYGRVKRAKKATVTAYDERGTRFTRGAAGLLAQIFQHEADHLDGVLFIDKATNLREMPR
ncbi:MAG: peptide deformylase [Parcubacteria group bacterium Greene0416_79]|nr:MAG: peptide deformylase [Parcubacteria group bacterium Greene0416_79]